MLAYDKNKRSDMLYWSDIHGFIGYQRKVLRVTGNYSAGRRRTPTADELCIKTGRNRGGIMTVLEVLANEEYIKWKRTEPDKMLALEAWERKGDSI